MPDYSPPFANNGDLRYPTANERSLGFPCGPADQKLFNALFNILYGNIGDIAQHAGVTPNAVGDHTTLKRAVLALIQASVGTLPDPPDLTDFVLMSHARSRLLFFPEVLNANATIVPTVPSTGQIRIPAGQTFLHRGIMPINTSDFSEGARTLSTVASRTYHLRWTVTDGFVLRDLSSGSYNPGSLHEKNQTFDSNYDDMLIARVITNSSNAANITPLVNRDRLFYHSIVSGAPYWGGTGKWWFDHTWIYNWARTPKMFPVNGYVRFTAPSNAYVDGVANQVEPVLVDGMRASRYSIFGQIVTDWSIDQPGGYVGGSGHLTLNAHA